MSANRGQIHEWNKYISRIIQAGLIGKWSKDHQRNDTPIDQQVGGSPMGIQHFYGSFSMCSLFLLMAAFAFIFELIIHLKSGNCAVKILTDFGERPIG